MKQGEGSFQFKAPSTIKEMGKPSYEQLEGGKLGGTSSHSTRSRGFYQHQDLGGSMLP
jgi:hypothetical protein